MLVSGKHTLRASGGIGRRAELKIRDILWVRVPPRPSKHHLGHTVYMHAVIDTSPLQAFWRTEKLQTLRTFFEGLIIAQAVDDETRRSFVVTGPELVPNLNDERWITVQDVSDAELRCAMQLVFKAYQSEYGKKWKKTAPEIEFVNGKIVAWTTKDHRRSIDVPDLATVVLAKRLGAIAILDDSAALDMAKVLGVETATTLEVARVLSRDGIIELASFEEALERKKYSPLRRNKDAWDGIHHSE